MVVVVALIGPEAMMSPELLIHTASAPLPSHLPAFVAVVVVAVEPLAAASLLEFLVVDTLGNFALTIEFQALLSPASASSSAIVFDGASMNSYAG